jgi:P2 family phage contractile tail tube protein
MAINVNRVTNANIYLTGTGSLLGRAEEISLPDVKASMSDHKAIGMFGKLELPSGIDKMECKIKWNAIYPEVAKKFNDIFASREIQVRYPIENYTAQGRTGTVGARVAMTVLPKNIPLGNFKQHDNVELEQTFTVTYFKMEVDGVIVTEIDVLNNIYIVDGVDKLAAYRAALGA